MIEASNRFANALRDSESAAGDVLAVHTPQRPETAIAQYRMLSPRRDRTADFELFGPTRSNTASRTVQRKRSDGAGDRTEDGRDRSQSIPNFKHVITTDGAHGGLSFDDS